MDVKIALVGTRESGKTRFIHTIHSGADSTGPYLPTIGIYALKTPLLIDCQETRLHIFDAGGNVEYQPLLPLFIHDSAILLFFVCGTRPNDDAGLFQLHDYLVTENALPPESVKAVVCSFADIGIDPGLHDRVSNWASQHGYPYFEMNCQNYDQVASGFEELLYKRLRTDP